MCEYISVCSLFNYFHTTKKLKYYTDDQIDEFYNKPFNNKKIDHKYHYWNERTKAVPWQMWKKNKYSYNIKFRESMKDILKSWLPYSTWKKINLGSSTSTMHSSQPEKWLQKYGVPVLFSFVVEGFAHNVIIYGYNKDTNEYAVHFGWSGEKYARVILKKSKMWSYFSIGFWLALKEK